MYIPGETYEITVTSTKKLAHMIQISAGRLTGENGKHLSDGGSCRWRKTIAFVTTYQWEAPNAPPLSGTVFYALCGRSLTKKMQVATPMPTSVQIVTAAPTKAPTNVPTSQSCKNGVKDII